MSVNINDFKNFTEFLSNKAQAGNSLTPAQFNQAANRAQVQVFEKDRAVYVSEELTSDFLSTFLKTKIFNGPFVTGEIIKPTDFQHIANVRSYHIKDDGVGTNVDLKGVKSSNWGEIISSSLSVPTSRWPKYSEYGNTLRILPTDLDTVTIDYFKTPIKPVWAFTVVNGRPVYDATNSVNFEWDDFATNNVAAYFLQLVGVNLKDGELANFANMYKQETNSVI